MKKEKMKKIEKKRWSKQERALWNVNQDNEKCWRDARDECDSSYSNDECDFSYLNDECDSSYSNDECDSSYSNDECDSSNSNHASMQS
jgi:hypothetical protein